MPRSKRTGRFLSQNQKNRIELFRKKVLNNENVEKVTIISDDTIDSSSDVCIDGIHSNLCDEHDKNESFRKTSDAQTKTLSVNIDEIESRVDEEDDDQESSDNIKWCDGRSIFEWSIIVDALNKGCTLCEMPLTLRNIVFEQRLGIGSLLYLKYSQTSCNTITAIPTGKRHFVNNAKTGSRAWDINTKLSLAMIHAGIGSKKVLDFLSTLNIPAPNKSTLKDKERTIGPTIEVVAQESCSKAAEDEKLNASDKGISVSFDAGWQKRGSGKSYSSLSGHAALIGKTTGKCVAFASRNKFCRTCDYAEKHNTGAVAHDCRKNWSNSSKAMEPDMCVSMLHNLQNDSVSVDNLIMDNDTTTLAKVRSEVDASVKKVSDKNHTLKQLSNRLYELKQSKKYKELNPKTIAHLSKCFRYCVCENKGNSDAIKDGLKAITPHVFGAHDLCNLSWCKYLQSPDTYKPRNLPYRRYLQDKNLKNDVEHIFLDFASQSDNFSKLGSTQVNESLNNTVASKAPKAQFFSGSESNDFRVASAVAHKNIGYQYVTKVNETKLLSPGKASHKRCQENDLNRKRAREKEDTIEYKKGGWRKRNLK